ncbi:two-component system, LytT family, sensor kinase [Micromonospora phaseoli]|uniref:Two-component system, LytT family, sensor kinase n=1 Tax=Micromonospora phaseoli TaxID=1144548 RepID=A0A1H7B6T7_9ACTN|nr:histidine kinase [Micromonospora phaseoli]PZV95161.1 two-component system LytT family sensor kinase [Micromonospora phaseoli]GIJ78981.1 signal transduction histidine kinase [Micromonospora phaseoli]SEJ73521.1 two-component system, LytT family, sensor kinase [Micromonospora phaseoli]
MGGNLSAVLGVFALVTALTAALFAVGRLRGRRGIATPGQRATYEVLHTAGLAAEPLRAGLNPAGAAKAARHLRTLIGSDGLALTDTDELLALDGRGAHHGEQLRAAARRVVTSERSTVLGESELPCDRIDCPVRGAVVAPLGSAEGRIAGALVAVTDGAPAPGLVQATLETAHWAGSQLALAELDSSRERLARAEIRALRAQISPHFIYNALTAIGSFVRTDPERARELILEFAEFTRYSFRAHGEFTTLAEELRSIDRYLTIERARFGDRLQVRLQIAPEVLPVTLPFLCLQPLVENAVRHGLSRKPGTGMVSIEARDAGSECHITVEDDGVGMDPATLTAGIAELAGSTGDPGDDPGQHVGLSNVDERLRSVFGDGFGLVVETDLGSGTKVSMRVPKFHPGVRAGA